MTRILRKSVVLALAKGQDQHLAPLRDCLSLPLVVDQEWDPAVLDRYDIALLLVLSNDVWRSDLCLRAAMARRIPSLYLMDGILEFHHQWTSRRFAAGGGASYMTPVLADKIACLGASDARRLESWGNHGKCEIVGLPRLDKLLPPKRYSPSKRKPARILVSSANTPWHSLQQRESVLRGLSSLRQHAGQRTDVELVWRLTRRFTKELSLPDQAEARRQSPLSRVLQTVDAVITQPSTLQLEAMLCGLPVAGLDFENSPHFVPFAWRITAESHLRVVIDGLLDPKPDRLCYQDECLHDALACHSPATQRLASLIERMIVLGERARARGESLRLPDRMLPVEQSLPLSLHLDLQRQYRSHPTFGNTDLLDLQRRLAMSQQELRLAQEGLRRRSIGFWLGKAFRWLAKRTPSVRAPGSERAAGSLEQNEETRRQPVC